MRVVVTGRPSLRRRADRAWPAGAETHGTCRARERKAADESLPAHPRDGTQNTYPARFLER